ncbi:MAG: hypothetical protein ACYSWP_07985 [Planctomycetota bacterium]|jgi:hypothetical protein
MVNLSENAKKNLEHYLGQVRTCLRGSKSVDPDEVEQNIMDHIESELAGAAEPIAVAALDPVLAKLGSPEQWVPEEELSWWRKTVLRLRSGPEDWRLAYLSFGLLVFGLISGPGIIVLLPASFYIARTTIHVAGGAEQLGDQKRLIYPALIVVYFLLILAVIAGPTIVMLATLAAWEHSMTGEDTFFGDDTPFWIAVWMFSLAFTGLCLIITGTICFRARRFVEKVFYPFGDVISRKKAFVLILVAFVGLVIFSLLGVLVVKYWHNPNFDYSRLQRSFPWF